MKRIMSASGGLCSFFAAQRVKERYGTQDMVMLFADTLIEDPELYEFNDRAAELLGVPITRVSLELTPWQLFRREGYIGNDRSPLCSVYLKRKVLDAWIAENCLSSIQQLQHTLWPEERQPAIIYLGFDWTEEHRLRDIRAAKPDWQWEAPMTEEPIWDKCQMMREAERLGLPISWLYKAGFPHNNCGGRCVKAGISHFVHLYRVRPDLFWEWAFEERDTAEVLRARGIEACSVLKDRRGGVTKPLWLLDLAARIEAGEDFPKDEWGGCGCGGAVEIIPAPMLQGAETEVTSK